MTRPPRSRAHRWAGAVAWLLAAPLVPVAATALPAGAAETAAAVASDANGNCSQSPPIDASTGQPVTKSYNPQQSPLLLPPWGDAGGWINASSYETILAGDVDGDGWGDLIGRNGTTLDTYTPAPPERAWSREPFKSASSTVRPPFPLQWVPKAAVSPPPPGAADVFMPANAVPVFNEGATTATLATDQKHPAQIPGFGDPSRFTTMRLANIDGLPGDELLLRTPVFGPVATSGDHPYGQSANPYVRSYQGTYIRVFTFRSGAWQELVRNPVSSPGPTWPDVTGSSFGAQGNLAKGNGLSDPFFLPKYYQSITTGDVDGDGKDELIARGSQGLQVWSWDSTYNNFGSGAGDGSGDLPDSLGMDQGPQYWSTIRVADFIPGDNGKKELLARAPDGVRLYSLTVNGFGAPPTWTLKATIPSLSASTDPGTGYWNSKKASLSYNDSIAPEQASTLRTADVDGNGSADLLSMDTSGRLTVTTFDSNGTPSQLVPPTTIINATPAITSDPMYWSTLQGGNLGGGPEDEVLLRAADGLHAFRYRGGGGMAEVSGLFVPQLSDANGWTDPSKYLTIRTVPWASATNQATSGVPVPSRVLIARDATGVRTYWIDPTAPNEALTQPSAAFPSWAGGTDPNAFDTATPQGLAYKYLNDQIATIMNWGPAQYPGDASTPVYPSIRSKFATASGVTSWSDIATLVLLQPPPPDSVNISREDFEAIKVELADWVHDYDQLLGLFFSSATGIQQLLTTAIINGDVGFPIDEIEQQFAPPDHSRMWALIGDLIWGLMSAIQPEWIAALGFEKLSTNLGKQLFSFAMNLGGSAVGAGLTYADQSSRKQGQLDIEAAQLDYALASHFCAALAFLYGSANQAGDDLGLLTAMGQTVRSMPIDLQAYNDMVGALSRQRTIWAYQQFASMNPDGKSGTGWQETWSAEIDLTKYKPGSIAYSFAIGDAVYYPVGKDCGDTGRPSDAMGTLTNTLGVDPADLAGPTLAWWDKADSNYSKANVGDLIVRRLDPVPKGMSGTPAGSGTNGWHLPVTLGYLGVCGNTVYAP